MSPFDLAPEFIEWDNRQNRTMSPVSKEQMHNKHEVMFPPHLVEGRTILDLGCALGATGYWCLSAGAKYYQGVETQSTYATRGNELLAKYFPGAAGIRKTAIEAFLDEGEDVYDIVCLLGVLYAFTDYYSILRKVSSKASEMIVVESMYPYGSHFRPGFVGVQFLDNQDINLADENASLRGRGSRVSPRGLEFIMKDFGFVTDGQIHPKPILETADVYNNMDVPGPRFIMRFTRSSSIVSNLSTELTHGKNGPHLSW